MEKKNSEFDRKITSRENKLNIDDDLDRTDGNLVSGIDNIGNDPMENNEDVLNPRNSDHDTFESEEHELPPMEEEKLRIGEKPKPKLRNVNGRPIPHFVPEFVPKGAASKRWVQLLIKHKLLDPYKVWNGSRYKPPTSSKGIRLK